MSRRDVHDPRRRESGYVSHDPVGIDVGHRAVFVEKAIGIGLSRGVDGTRLGCLSLPSSAVGTGDNRRAESLVQKLRGQESNNIREFDFRIAE